MANESVCLGVSVYVYVYVYIWLSFGFGWIERGKMVQMRYMASVLAYENRKFLSLDGLS